MNALPALHLGAPTQAGPLTVFPVWTDAPIAPTACRTSLPADVRIDELPTPVVGKLRVTNPGGTPLLLLEGALLDGGWQHRVVTRSMLVDPQGRQDVQVACVEQNRWAGGKVQRLARHRAPLAVRGALRGLRAETPGVRGTNVDQGDVWRRVSRYERDLGNSPTSSLVDLQNRQATELKTILTKTRPLYGQRGVLIGAAGHPVLLEVYDDPQTLAEQWEALLSAVALDARLAPPQPTSGRRARAFIQRLAAVPIRSSSMGGRAVAVDADDDKLLSARGIALGNRLLHLAVVNAKHQFVLAG
ncbi:ARPP-1 family domain-containing protein [Micromonospora sp. DT47]|uniref:ARPP-1 family domain-containing protein n=1 Tax=Micromonospora sp. DT47 TaxID=3393431 RepID=UPI003CED3C06